MRRDSVRSMISVLALLATSPAFAAEPYEAVSDAQVRSLTFEDCTVDDDHVGPLAAGLDHLQDAARKRFDEWAAKLEKWEPAKAEALGEKVRALLTLAALADLARTEFEGEIAYAVFERLKKDVPRDKLLKAAAWVALHPGEGKATLSAPELGLDTPPAEAQIRERSVLYAKKLAGRLLGKLPVAR